jgi:hypothetical protein
LNDEEATARFAESGNFVGMCKDCRSYLPKNLKILTRPDLKEKKDKDDGYYEEEPPFSFDEDYDD